MKKTRILHYFAFGYNYNLLRFTQPGFSVRDDSDSLISRIDEFFEELNTLDLPVTRTAATDLRTLRKSLEKKYKDGLIDDELAGKVTEAINKLDTTLDAELSLRTAFVITPKRIDVTKLTSNVSSLFAPKVFEKLPRVAQYDLSEAGLCIAFQRSTAAGFHLMRATEAVLREFYCHHVKRNRVDLMWGPIIQGLSNKQKFKNDENYKILFNNLSNIRQSFRNPTQHPEKIYDIEEVQDLWGLCVDVINRMAKDLPEPEVPS